MSYTIFPRPKQFTEQNGSYNVTYPLTVSLPEALADLEALLSETLECAATVSADGAVSFAEDASLGQEAYRLTVDGQGVHIAYAARSGAYYALVTLGQLLHQTPAALSFCEIEDEPSLAVRGYMIDISRGKVPTLEDLCRQADRLAKMKYNQVQLYVEGFSFAYPSFPEVWKDVTPITGEEVQYFDAYCEARGIELVPNQNSLGHMSAWLARDEFKHLSEMRESDQGMAFMGNPMPASTLDAMDPASLDLVTAMMDDMMPFFHSDKFNVNLDEPFELGKGKNKALAEEKGEEYLYMDYLKRLHARVAERGKHMYMWGDILANHPETFSQLPKGVTVLDWGYEAFSPFEEHAALLEKEQVPFILCPGTSMWTSLTGRTDNMKGNILNSAKAAIAHHGEGVLVTSWGDGGHLEYESLNDGSIAYAASCCWGCLDTTEEETAAYLNDYVFHDKAGKAAQIIFDMGRLYHYEEFPMMNMTIASMILMMGVLPDGALSYALEQAIRSIQTFAPSAGPMIDSVWNSRKDFDFAGAMSAIEDLKTRLSETSMEGSKARLLYAELENALRIVTFAEYVHHLNASGATMTAEEKASVTAEIQTLGKEILQIHPDLWIERNKIHGMTESTAGIARILGQLNA